MLNAFVLFLNFMIWFVWDGLICLNIKFQRYAIPRSGQKVCGTCGYGGVVVWWWCVNIFQY